ncbi:anti-sigma factor [soil metagenome]
MTARKDDAASLSGAHALNALDGVDSARFEKHLRESEETRNEYTELSDTAVLLGLAVAPVDPPAHLKASIMAAVAGTPQLAAVPESGHTAESFSGAAGRKAQARWFARPVVGLAAAAAAVALIFGGGVLASTINQNMQQQAQADQLAAINSASDSRRIAAPMTGGGSATLVWSHELARAALIMDGLPPLSADKVYELWFIDSTGARAAGMFTVGSSGSMWRVLDGKMAQGDTVGVTVEPAGGSTTPTTAPIVAIASA